MQKVQKEMNLACFYTTIHNNHYKNMMMSFTAYENTKFRKTLDYLLFLYSN